MRHLARRSLRWRSIAVATAAATILASCGGSGGETGEGSGDNGEAECAIGALDNVTEPVEVTIWHNSASVSGKVLEEQIAAFNASQDKVIVEGQYQGATFEEVQQKFESATADRTLPALVTLEDTKTRWAADSGLFAPAQACIDADPEVKAQFDDLLPIVQQSYELDDQMIPVSFAVYTALIYYNQAHFRDAGLDVDTPPGTLDEIYEAAKAIKAKKPSVKPLAFTTAPWIFEWLMSGVRQPIVNASNGRDGVASESTLASDRAIEALELIQKMKSEGLVDVIPGTPGQVNHLLAMAQQTSSMVIDSSAAATTVAGVIDGTISAERLKEELGIDLPPDLNTSQLGLEIEAGPVPGLDEPGKGQVGGAVWYMPNTNSPEIQAAAWEFVKYLNAPENQAPWSIRGSNAPAFNATADVPALQDAFANTLGGRWQKTAFDVLKEGVDSSFPGPIIGPYTETRAAILKALDTALLEDGDARTALEEADATVTEQLGLYAQDVGA